jgi:hypothetical protein
MVDYKSTMKNLYMKLRDSYTKKLQTKANINNTYRSMKDEALEKYSKIEKQIKEKMFLNKESEAKVEAEIMTLKEKW